MDKLAMRILKEIVTPQSEKLLHPSKDQGITMMELDSLGKIVDIAKDLLEIDCMMKELKLSDPEGYKKEAHKDMYGGGAPGSGVTF